MNRTVQTNISDETILRRRQQGQYHPDVQMAKPFVVQSFMKKPNKTPPVEHVQVLANNAPTYYSAAYPPPSNYTQLVSRPKTYNGTIVNGKPTLYLNGTPYNYERPIPVPTKVYSTANVPPLLKPKTDYASYLSQTGSASYVNPNNQPKVIYRCKCHPFSIMILTD